MKLIDLLIGETPYRFEREEDESIWVYDDAHNLCAIIDGRGQWIEYRVTGVYNNGIDMAEIDITALRSLEKIAGKIAEDLEDES